MRSRRPLVGSRIEGARHPLMSRGRSGPVPAWRAPEPWRATDVARARGGSGIPFISRAGQTPAVRACGRDQGGRDAAWDRLTRNQGQAFQTVTGLPFTYEVLYRYFRVSRTGRNLSRANFDTAVELMPCDGPATLRGLQSASYVHAILMDPRLRAGAW